MYSFGVMPIIQREIKWLQLNDFNAFKKLWETEIYPEITEENSFDGGRNPLDTRFSVT